MHAAKLVASVFWRELNEIGSVTNINSNINSIYLPMIKIDCEITQAYNGARSLTELPLAPREPP